MANLLAQMSVMVMQGFECCTDCTFCARMHYLRITAQKRCFFFKLCRTCAKMFDYKRSTINVKIGRKNPSRCIFLFFRLFKELSQRSVTLLSSQLTNHIHLSCGLRHSVTLKFANVFGNASELMFSNKLKLAEKSIKNVIKTALKRMKNAF